MPELQISKNYTLNIIDEEQHQRMDRVSILVSIICLIHCLMVPLITLSFPFLSTLDSYTSKTHLIMAVVVITFGILALFKGFKHHNKVTPISIGIIGMFFIVSALFSHPNGTHNHVYLDIHTNLTIIGSVLLVIAHYINMRSCKC